MTLTVLYGLSNCDTVKKARAWFGQRGDEVRFHDFKRAGVPPDRLDAWMDAVGCDRLLNRRGTTWRQLDEMSQEAAQEVSGARALMLRQPNVIKRPVVEWPNGEVSVGFEPSLWAQR